MEEEPMMTPDKCHAGAGHAAPTDHGPWGWLCDECWAWVERLRERLRGKR